MFEAGKEFFCEVEALEGEAEEKNLQDAIAGERVK